MLANGHCVNGCAASQVGLHGPPAVHDGPADRSDIVHVGGFSAAVLSVPAAFLAEDSNGFVAEVDPVKLPSKSPPVQGFWAGSVSSSLSMRYAAHFLSTHLPVK
jgi:hypothetical protein